MCDEFTAEADDAVLAKRGLSRRQFAAISAATMGSMAFRKKEVFQGHIFSLRENYFVSPCGIFHNISVTKIIINAAENIKKNNKGRTNEDLLWLLSRLKLKAERFLKISPENIYKQEIGDTGGGWLSKITG